MSYYVHDARGTSTRKDYYVHTHSGTPLSMDAIRAVLRGRRALPQAPPLDLTLVLNHTTSTHAE